MKIGALGEISSGESRVAMTPDSALQLKKLGYPCVVQAGAGKKAGFLTPLMLRPVLKYCLQPKLCLPPPMWWLKYVLLRWRKPQCSARVRP